MERRFAALFAADAAESPPREYTGKVDGTCHSERNEIGRCPSPEHGC
jgi:hypothetical protein